MTSLDALITDELESAVQIGCDVQRIVSMHAIYGAIPYDSRENLQSYSGGTYNMELLRHLLDICVSQSILQQIFRSQRSSVKALTFPVIMT